MKNLKSMLKVYTFFHLEIVIISCIIVIISCISGIYIKNNIKNTEKMTKEIIMSHKSNVDVVKYTNRFFIIDEKIFSESLSKKKINIDFDLIELNKYKELFTLSCDKRYININKVDTLVYEKEKLFKNIKLLSINKIKLSKLKVTDSVKQVNIIQKNGIFNHSIKRNITYKKYKKIDNHLLFNEIKKLENDNEIKTEYYITRNLNYNLQLRNIIYVYLNTTDYNININNTQLMNNLKSNLKIYYLITILLLSILTIVIIFLTFDIKKKNKSLNRGNFIVNNLIEQYKKKD